MDDNRKTKPIFTDQVPAGRNRVILLVLAGALLVGAAYYAFNELKKREEPNPTMAGSELPVVTPGATRPLPGGNPPPVNIAGGKYTPKPVPVVQPVASKPPQTMPQPAQQPAPTGTNPQAPVKPLPNPSLAAGTATFPAPGTATVKPQPALPVTPVASVPPQPNRITPSLPNLMPGQPLPQVQPPNAVAGQPPAQPGLPNAIGAQTPPQPFAFTPKSIPSTSRLVAAAEAKALAGRSDPCAPLAMLKPFPRTGRDDQDEPALKPEKEDKSKISKDLGKLTPPPPPPGAPSLVPPPPPGEGLSVAELPAPPAKPSVSSKMKLVAIVGDRAILSFADRGFARDNKYPKSITLGPGDQFESLSVVGVNNDSVTLEEDGERSIKTIEPLK